MSVRSIVLSALLVAAIASPAVGQEAGDPSEGQRLAAANCAQCHGAVDMRGGAPAFATIAATPSTTEYSLSMFLQTPHALMPDLGLTGTDISDLVAYILSLRS
jgi:mono/diheme cytochrome c family protein